MLDTHWHSKTSTAPHASKACHSNGLSKEKRNKSMKELVFYNKDCPVGHKTETIKCDAASVKRIVQWYGGFHARDRVTLHINGVKAKLDHNLELVT
jgi:hypothetical protein